MAGSQVERLQRPRARVANPERVRLLIREHPEQGGESVAFPGNERFRLGLARFDLVDTAGDAAENDGAVLQRRDAFRKKVLGLVDGDFGPIFLLLANKATPTAHTFIAAARLIQVGVRIFILTIIA